MFTKYSDPENVRAECHIANSKFLNEDVARITPTAGRLRLVWLKPDCCAACR